MLGSRLIERRAANDRPEAAQRRPMSDDQHRLILVHTADAHHLVVNAPSTLHNDLAVGEREAQEVPYKFFVEKVCILLLKSCKGGALPITAKGLTKLGARDH